MWRRLSQGWPGRRTRPCSPCTAHCQAGPPRLQAGPLHRQRRCWGRRGPPCHSRGDMKVAVAVATRPAARESGRSARGSACSALAHLRFRSIPRRARPTDAPSPPPTASDRPSLPSSGLGRTPSPPRPGPRGRLFPATSACRALPVTQVTSLAWRAGHCEAVSSRVPLLLPGRGREGRTLTTGSVKALLSRPLRPRRPDRRAAHAEQNEGRPQGRGWARRALGTSPGCHAARCGPTQGPEGAPSAPMSTEVSGGAGGECQGIKETGSRGVRTPGPRRRAGIGAQAQAGLPATSLGPRGLRGARPAGLPSRPPAHLGQGPGARTPLGSPAGCRWRPPAPPRRR